MDQNNNQIERTSKLRNFLEKTEQELNQILEQLEQNITDTNPIIAIPNPQRTSLSHTLFRYQGSLNRTNPTFEPTFNEEVIQVLNRIRSSETTLGLRLLLQEIERKLK